MTGYLIRRFVQIGLTFLAFLTLVFFLIQAQPGDFATFYAVTGLCYAANTIVGGVLHDRYRDHTFTFFADLTLDYYQWIFLLGWIARSLGVLVLLLVIEDLGRRTDGLRPVACPKSLL